jgi:hypothetical protein
MNLDSIVKQGRLPWRPNDQVGDLDVWHEYETPLTGVFRMQDRTVLFTMVYEYDHDVSIWAYLELDDDVTRELSEIQFDSVEALTAWVEAQFAGREAVLALARADRIASRWTRQTVRSNLLDATDDFLSAVIKSVDEVRDTATRVRAKLAGVDAAGAELPDRTDLLEV